MQESTDLRTHKSFSKVLFMDSTNAELSCSRVSMRSRNSKISGSAEICCTCSLMSPCRNVLCMLSICRVFFSLTKCSCFLLIKCEIYCGLFCLGVKLLISGGYFILSLLPRATCWSWFHSSDLSSINNMKKAENRAPRRAVGLSTLRDCFLCIYNSLG